MKKLIMVLVGMGTLYVFLLRAISNFITRDKDDYLASLEVTGEDSPVQTRKEYLHRQTLDTLFEMACQSVPTSDDKKCYDASEQAYIRQEVAKLEDILSKEPDKSSNIHDTFIAKEHVVNREVLVYDIWYKRILTDILLHRERQIPYLSNHKK